MVRKVVILALLIFFVIGAVGAMAADNKACKGKGALQSMYNWFGTWDKVCTSSSERCCKACEKKCCEDCNIDCGGTCCSGCVKK